MAKKPVVYVPLAVDELIDEAFKTNRTRRFVDSPLPAVPEHFPIKVGSMVEIGQLEECQVVAIRGPIFAIRYNTPKSRDNPNPANPDSYAAWYWWDMVPLPLNPNKNIHHGRVFSIDDRYHHHFSATHLQYLINRGCANEFKDNPEYQRGYVWTEQDKEGFIDSVFGYVDLGKFVLVRYEWPNNFIEVLDGKQRINCLVDYILGKYTYRGKYWWELSRSDRFAFENRTIQIAELDGSKMKHSDRLHLFLQVNAAGVPQTKEHLTLVRRLYEQALEKEKES